MSESGSYPTDNQAADGPGPEEWSKGFGDDGIRKAHQYSEQQSDGPTGHGKSNIYNHKSDCKPGDKRCGMAKRLSGKLIGIIIATSKAPKISPQIAPNSTRDIPFLPATS
jgi:hypothetical protein